MATNLRFVARIDGSLQEILNQRFDELGVGLRAAVQSAAEKLQRDLRQQVRDANLGQGLENAWRLEVYPQRKNRARNPGALVWSKSVRLHDAFDKGGTIRTRNADWLVIPLPAAIEAGWDHRRTRKGSDRGGSLMARWSNVEAAVDKFGKGRLRFVPLQGAGRALLVAEAGVAKGSFRRLADRQRAKASVPMFLLVRQVKLRKQLDIQAAADRAIAQLKSNIDNLLKAA